MTPLANISPPGPDDDHDDDNDDPEEQEELINSGKFSSSIPTDPDQPSPPVSRKRSKRLKQ
jgi:hypothetical protein